MIVSISNIISFVTSKDNSVLFIHNIIHTWKFNNYLMAAMTSEESVL